MATTADTTQAKTDQSETLWQAFVDSPSDETRNALVEHYQPLVREIVRRFASRLPKTVDRGDLETAGNLGMISAVKSFDASRNVRFEAYAELRVRGALLDELRTEDWLPRPWRQRVEAQKRAFERLRTSLGRRPRDYEVAEVLEMSLEDYQAYFGVGLPGSQTGLGSTDGSDDALSIFDMVPAREETDPGDQLTNRELLALVTQRMSELEIRIVYLKYWEDLPMREIGELAGLSESRVCKIHAALIRRMQTRFQVASA